jgi:hypothetical protein
MHLNGRDPSNGLPIVPHASAEMVRVAMDDLLSAGVVRQLWQDGPYRLEERNHLVRMIEALFAAEREQVVAIIDAVRSEA